MSKDKFLKKSENQEVEIGNGYFLRDLDPEDIKLIKNVNRVDPILTDIEEEKESSDSLEDIEPNNANENLSPIIINVEKESSSFSDSQKSSSSELIFRMSEEEESFPGKSFKPKDVSETKKRDNKNLDKS